METPVNMHHVTLHRLLDGLIEKYGNNEYVFGRLCNYMEKLLPVALDNAVIIYKQRDDRKKQLTCDKDEFTSRFLQKNNYFYSSQSELFLHYDGLHFKVYSEDDIQHQILTTITNEQNLMDWKHKTNNNILKRIKEKTPLSAIPESATIQFVINSLYPVFFTTRNQAKYFLTIIGDCLMAHNGGANASAIANTSAIASASASANLIYIISPIFKELLRELNNQSYAFFGISNILNNIKFKYYAHNYTDCRLIQFNNKIKKITLTTELMKHMIDLLCVASHYSQRYGSADLFLQECTEVKLVEHALFLNKNTTDGIVDKFLERTITALPMAKVDSKNMLFLWKNYLGEQNIPNIVFYTTLKNILKTKYTYDEETDCYLDITSTQLPVVAKFSKFWEATILGEEEAELEVDEIVILFKQWINNGKSCLNMNETLVVDLIRHFYPDIIIVNNKFIQNIKSSVWDKRNEVINSLELFKLKCSEQEELMTKSLNDAYEYYTSPNALDASQTLNASQALLASKNYFEKIALELINVHIDADGLIKASWWKN